MSIYPNPVEDNLFIELNDSNEATVEVFDGDGQLIIQKTITSSQKNMITDHMPTGMYWVKITSDKGIITKKFIKN